MDTMLEIAKRVDAFMMDQSPVHDTMRRLAKAFNDLEIAFAIAGAMATNAHGHRRTTADVDVLLRREDLVRFKERWTGRGWLDIFEGSKGFKDTMNGVRHPANKNVPANPLVYKKASKGAGAIGSAFANQPNRRSL